MNERKENMQTDRVANNITQKYAYRRSGGRTDTQTNGHIDRQYSNW